MTSMKPVSTRSAAAAPEGRQPTVLLFGDSHSYAVQRAVEKRRGKGRSAPLAVHRLMKEKDGKKIGDTTFEAFLTRVQRLGPGDVVLSMIGGNQHAVLSTIQHPQPFDFFTPDHDEPPTGDVEIIPFRALANVFSTGLRRGDGTALQALRKATQARVVHIIPPPPKADNAFIEKHHETLFATAGIASRGVSSPSLRLKFWKLQTRILRRMCNKLGIEVLMPPALTIEAPGFLRHEYYAEDATHANWLYGERLIREIEKRYVQKQGARAGG